MKKILLIIFLIFSIASLIAEIVLNFRETKASYYSLNFEKNFVAKKFYYKYYHTDPGTGRPPITIIGYLEGTTKSKALGPISGDFFDKYRKLDNGENIYYDVWYNKKTDVIYLKTNETGFFGYNGLCLLIVWILSVPAIVYLIKNKKRGRN